MPNAHLYLFSDACPSDWLVEGQDDVWHTIVNFIWQSDPALQPLIDQRHGHEEVLAQDTMYAGFVGALERLQGPLRKWSTGPSYRARFCSAFSALQPEYRRIVSACSFQERTLRESKDALLRSYNSLIGGIEGRGIGFEEFVDEKGRPQMRHSFLNSFGFHQIQAPASQMLVLLFMSWFIADQFVFYMKDIVRSDRYGFDHLGITVVSDKLSGDDDLRRKSEQNLRNLTDPDGEGVPLVLTRSQHSDTFSGDLLVDNLAGWLNAAISDPSGEPARAARYLIPSGLWKGWQQLVPSVQTLEARPAIDRLQAMGG